MYTDAHRSFLQYLTAKRLLTAPEVNAAYLKACDKYEGKTKHFYSLSFSLTFCIGNVDKRLAIRRSFKIEITRVKFLGMYQSFGMPKLQSFLGGFCCSQCSSLLKL